MNTPNAHLSPTFEQGVTPDLPPPPPFTGNAPRLQLLQYLQDRYFLLEELSCLEKIDTVAEGRSTVYKAYDDEISREVALKFFAERRPYEREEVTHELEFALQFANTEGIVPVVEAGTISIGGVAHRYLVTEFRQKGTLEPSKIEQPGQAKRVASIAAGAAKGLRALKNHHLVYGDTKPHNIAENDEGRGELLDLGTIALSSSLPPQDMFVGTPGYSAPEALEGSAPEPEIDVYGLGAALYEATTKTLPYGVSFIPVKLRTPTAVRAAQDANELIAPIDITPAMPRDFSKFIVQCLHRQAARRPSIEGAEEQLLAFAT